MPQALALSHRRSPGYRLTSRVLNRPYSVPYRTPPKSKHRSTLKELSILLLADTGLEHWTVVFWSLADTSAVIWVSRVRAWQGAILSSITEVQIPNVEAAG